MRKIWRKVFESKNSEYIMASEALESLIEFQKPSVGQNYLKESMMIFENGDCIGGYYIKSELRNYIKAILREIIINPEKLKKVQDKNIVYNGFVAQILFKGAKRL